MTGIRHTRIPVTRVRIRDPRTDYGYGGGSGVVGGGVGSEPPELASDALTCPRISPAAFLAVWTLTYVPPDRILRSCACEMFEEPR